MSLVLETLVIYFCNNLHAIGVLHTHSLNEIVYKIQCKKCHVIIYLKVKFGVRRERVPFVLARDFEIIIDKHYGFDK